VICYEVKEVEIKSLQVVGYTNLGLYLLEQRLQQECDWNARLTLEQILEVFQVQLSHSGVRRIFNQVENQCFVYGRGRLVPLLRQTV
jgi:hypothetical protein